MNEQQNKTMDKQYILVPLGTLAVCINTLKLIHPTDFDGMDHLVAVVRELQIAIQKGMQEGNKPEGNKPEEIKLEVIEPEKPDEAEK